MLAQQFRFHGYSSLKFLYRSGKTYRSKSLSVRVAPNSRRHHSRCAVVVTKKVHKVAPSRNRIRRRVYEIIRNNWSHIVQPYDILINVYDPVATHMPHEQLEQGIIELLKQAGVWHESQKDGEAT